MNRIFLLICLAAVSFADVTAQRTSRRNLKVETVVRNAHDDAVDQPCDTVVSPRAHTVDVNGYDKPLRSRRESFFVTNNSDSTVCGLAFTVTYYDTQHRQLHVAKKNMIVDIPPSETRQISYRSWDEQQSFYYVRSTVPSRVSQATPYEVAISVDTLFVR